MAQTLGADAEGFPDGFGAGGFPGVVGKAEAGGARFGVDGAERFGAGAPFVAAKADADDGRELCAEFDGLADNTFGLGHGEVADCVKDPENGEAQFAFGAVAGALESRKDGFEARGIVIAPHVDDADGDVDLGMDYTLFCEVLAHAPSDEFVVVGVDELTGNGFEGFDEAGEVSELVDGFRGGEGDRRGVVAPAEFDEGSGCDGAFKMEMEFGFGKSADERCDVVHL